MAWILPSLAWVIVFVVHHGYCRAVRKKGYEVLGGCISWEVVGYLNGGEFDGGEVFLILHGDRVPPDFRSVGKDGFNGCFVNCW